MNNFRTIIIGDVHGCVDELSDLIYELRLTKKDTLIFVGDLIDKGPDSPGVIKLISQNFDVL